MLEKLLYDNIEQIHNKSKWRSGLRLLWYAGDRVFAIFSVIISIIVRRNRFLHHTFLRSLSVCQLSDTSVHPA